MKLSREAKQGWSVGFFVILFVVGMLYFILQIPMEAQGQWTGGSGEVTTESATKPASVTTDYIRTTDYQHFEYSPTAARYLGETLVYEYSGASAGWADVGSFATCDTSVANASGYNLVTKSKLVRADWASHLAAFNVSAACTAIVWKFGPAGTKAVMEKILVSKKSSMFTGFTAADTADSGQVIAMELKNGAGSVPDIYSVRLYWREVVTP